jgi:hypothetical protein
VLALITKGDPPTLPGRQQKFDNSLAPIDEISNTAAKHIDEPP